MTITDFKQLPELVDLVHDHWFDVERIGYDRDHKAVTFRVEPRKADLAKGTGKGLLIEVRNVEDLNIRDTEKVRDYDINEITFDPATRTIALTGGIPIEIRIRVRDLEIHASPAVAPRA